MSNKQFDRNRNKIDLIVCGVRLSDREKEKDSFRESNKNAMLMWIDQEVSVFVSQLQQTSISRRYGESEYNNGKEIPIIGTELYGVFLHSSSSIVLCSCLFR